MLDIKQITLKKGLSKSLNEISLSVNEGEAVVISGDSGIGKSFLFTSCVGLSRPTSGDVLVDEVSLYYSDFVDLALSRRKLGVIFQKPAIISNLTVYENIKLASETHMNEIDTGEKEEIVRKELDAFN